MGRKFLLDFDGTVVTEDVGHQVLVHFGDDEVKEIDDRWVAGEITTRERAEAQFVLMNISEDELVEFVDGFELDPFFGEFCRYCRAAGIEFEIVSDGFDFYIERLLHRAGLGEVPVTCNTLEFVDGRIRLGFPHEGDGDGRFGVAKDVLLKRAQAEFEVVGYAGDADSDKPAAGVADVLFAKEKKALARYCKKEGIAYTPYTHFGDIIAALTGIWDQRGRRVPADGSFYELARAFERVEAVSGRIAMAAYLAELLRNLDPEDGGRIAYLLQGRVAPTFLPVEFGVGEKMLVSAIAAAFDVGPVEVEERFKEMGDFGLVAESFAKFTAGSRSVAEIFASLETIAAISGEGSVERKVEKVAEVMRSLGSLENRYFARIPIERLRLGVGDPTILDALSFAGAGDKSERAEIERAYNMVSDLGLVAGRYLAGRLDGLAGIQVEVGNPVRMAQAA
ncbi:MAG: MtnX-like HAD-IB family phosphatase, partial [Chloroflexota bacterium]|nr:MtnX-like HAD-IB family phosphatase [Chloroflexota bacterium]